MDPVFLIILVILSVVISIACIVGSIFIYRTYISTCSIGEFLGMVKTQGYLKSLFRFDKLVSPKIIQFFYGLNAIAIIGGALILLISSILFGISNSEVTLIVGGIIGCIAIVFVGEIFLRIGYEVAILFFKMNESLAVLKDIQLNGCSMNGVMGNQLANEAFASASNSVNDSARGNQTVPQPSVPQMKICSNCGTQNKPNARFCKGCGTAF